MSTNIGTLPLPAGRSRSWPAAPLALLAALLIAAGVASYLALRDDGPAASSGAVSQGQSIAGRGQAFAEQARQQATFSSFPSVAALERQAAIDSRAFPSVAALERQVASYGNSGVGSVAPSLAELRGVDVIGIGTAGLWAKEGPIEGSHTSAPGSNDCRFVRHGPC
jgi:hypothetical protein